MHIHVQLYKDFSAMLPYLYYYSVFIMSQSDCSMLIAEEEEEESADI